MTEFRPVPGVPRLAVNELGEVRGPSGRVLCAFPDKRGYRHVNLYTPGRGWRQFTVHRLVCETFHGPRPAPDAIVAHGDGDPGNNAAGNLRWSTAWQNEADKREHGTAMIGERHHQAKLTEQDVRAIRASAEAGALLARRYGVTPSAVCSIRKRRTWAHLS